MPFLLDCSPTSDGSLGEVPGDLFGQNQLSVEEISDGLTLRVGTGRVVEKLGTDGGYFENPDIHMPLNQATADQ